MGSSDTIVLTDQQARAARELQRRQDARDHLLPFVTYTFPDFEVGPHHRIICDYLEKVESGEIKRLIITMPPRCSKALEVSTPIPTPDGFRPMGELQPGDYVLDLDRKPTLITASHFLPLQPLYKSTISDGEEILSGPEHLWSVAHPDNPGHFQLLTSMEMGLSLVRQAWFLPGGRAMRVDFAGEHGAVQCIQVDAPDGMFLCGRTFVPTHNSELVSRRLPAWYLGRHPDRFIITATYGQDLSDELGEDVLGIVGGEDYGRIFEDVRLSPDTRAKKRWRIDNRRGIYIASSVGSPILGKGAHLFLIDDPFKTLEEVESVHHRERVWGWYRGVVFTRLQPDASIILIMQRWHDDDLVGRLLEQAEANDDIQPWTVLKLKAEAVEGEHDPLGRKPGEALWPAWYGKKALREIRAVQGERLYASMYQQEPIPEKGDYFQNDWFNQTYDKVPHRDTMITYATSDYAASESKGDWTVHQIWGIDPTGRHLLLDLWRGRKEPIEWAEIQVSMILRWKPLKWAVEMGSIWRATEGFLRKMMREKGAFTEIKEYPSIADKEIRARAYRGMAAMGMFFLPENASWKSDFIFEHSRFPAAKTDDIVDAGSLYGRMIEDLRPGRARKAEPDYMEPSSLSVSDYVKMATSKRRTKHRAPMIGRHPIPQTEVVPRTDRILR